MPLQDRRDLVEADCFSQANSPVAVDGFSFIRFLILSALFQSLVMQLKTAFVLQWMPHIASALAAPGDVAFVALESCFEGKTNCIGAG